MRKRLEFVALYGISWVVLFQLFRILFLAYHYKRTFELPPLLWFQSARHGLQMDISFAAYILVIPTLLLIFTTKKWEWYRKALRIFSFIIVFLITLLVVTDLELFRAWGFRIDGTSLHYLETPVEAWASMAAAPVFALLVLFASLCFMIDRIFAALIKRVVGAFKKSGYLFTIPVFLVLTGSLIIPIRGGLQLAPMNESAVFFSDKSFANYAAVNVPWNYMSSLLNATYSKNNPFSYFPENDLNTMISPLYQKGGETIQVLDTTKRLNVVVIIWESFTAKVVGHLNGVKGVTPQFDKLSKDGMLFTNLYASGNRSDKGMVAILSGYPAQPTNSIIKIPKKTMSLPSLPKEFHKNGWYTSFYYGGETEFANMKSYFLQQGFDNIIDKNDFEKKDMNSKWGAHDHIVLNKLLNDLDAQKEPFFTTLFTLSSHEPFEVPVKTAIPGSDPEHLFLNAHHYTDASIGDFIAKAKKKPWWSNTLVIIIADHGHPLPETDRSKPAEFHIPMLWLGGAIANKKMKIDSLCSQTDLPATLLNQLHLPSGQFQWSNDIFKKDRNPFAYFVFNNGLGWIKPGGFLVRDNIGGNITEKGGKLDNADEKLGKAFLQASFTDYLRR
ncbi:LTA synthase family protein [Dyadobacter arcticus]|uniref:Phosphoglycerol transferase MdoB-like AlkP superfamily enzyme n=1 Tax=Dyadobacter arcticus TaxID=1078754 RepID=A0ABX0UQ54_9BACT|nr:alkaline phosphatase family protein [Dyadobacter arcticus]NIJ54254.1 phosphoglycerol transferase MdoB-like AlkP superfamily enzyme [Dyadobacter arcticus]